jgi:hypothetical protein
MASNGFYRNEDDQTATIFVRRRCGELIELLIDLDDFDRVMAIPTKWSVVRSTTGDYYGRTGDTRSTQCVLLHRLIMNAPQGQMVDHINGNTLDNRKANLRCVSAGQNRTNLGRTASKSGHLNVSYRKDKNTWRVRASVNGKEVYFGSYADINDAIAAAKNARMQHVPDSRDSLLSAS